MENTQCPRCSHDIPPTNVYAKTIMADKVVITCPSCEAMLLATLDDASKARMEAPE